MFASLKSKFNATTLRKKILIIITILSSFIPTILISTLAFSYYNLGIKSVFNEKIDKLIANTIYVSEAYLQEHKQSVKIDAISITRDIEMNFSVLMEDQELFNIFLDKQAQLRKLSEVFVFDSADGLIAKNSSALSLFFEKIKQSDIDEASASNDVVLIENPYNKVRALIKLRGFYSDTYLMVGKFVDPAIIENIKSTKGSADQYQQMVQEIALKQNELEYSFIIASAIMCLASIWIGVRLSRIIIKPINNLVLATTKITKGDYSAKVAAPEGKDETAILSRAFNTMIATISEQREKLINYNNIIDERRRFIETVLAEISAGVITLNRDCNIILYNTSADNLLSMHDVHNNAHYMKFFPEIEQLLKHVSNNPTVVISDNIEVMRDVQKKHFFVRIGAQLSSDGAIESYVVTFDDISELVSAQRSAAWADVARRIAHEIKNPLTPIQLSAERIKTKYLPQIAEDDESFKRYVDTIIKHVREIEKIVEEFVRFARIPVPVLKKTDLMQIINDLVFSQKYIYKNIEYTVDAENQNCDCYCDAMQISQVLLNVLKNAAESIEMMQRESDQVGSIMIRVTTTQDNFAKIIVEDNGIGLDSEILDRIFEPYVTTKIKGTGLGLSIVRKIVEDHGGQIMISPSKSGAKVTISLRLYNAEGVAK